MTKKLDEELFTSTFLIHMGMLATTAIGFYAATVEPDMPFALFTGVAIPFMCIIAYYSSLKDGKK